MTGLESYRTPLVIPRSRNRLLVLRALAFPCTPVTGAFLGSCGLVALCVDISDLLFIIIFSGHWFSLISLSMPTPIHYPHPELE